MKERIKEAIRKGYTSFGEFDLDVAADAVLNELFPNPLNDAMEYIEWEKGLDIITESRIN